MKIAFNPLGSGALTKAPDNKDITFDLVGRVIYARGVPFDGKNTLYKTFKKHTSSDNTGGSEGLVPIPSYSTTNTRLLREDGLWVNIAGAAPPDTELSTESTNTVQNKVITNKINEILASMQLKAADVYKNIKVGTTTLVASGVNDTLEFKLGNGITITPNATNKTLEFSINATGNLGISTSYSNKQLIVKILDEYYNKWNAVYDWYISVTEEDTDDLINKWQEIVDFLNSVAEGTDILDEFVTRKTSQTITGAKTFSKQIISSVAQGTAPFKVTSTTKVTNLNADLLDGYSESAFLRYRGILTNNIDLDTYKSTGFYVNTSANGSGNSNFPEGYGYILTLEGAGSSSYYAGFLFGLSEGDVWIRNHWNYEWKPWRRLALSSEVDALKDYYWADQKISSSANAATSPTFANTTINGNLVVTGTGEFSNDLTIHSNNTDRFINFRHNNNNPYSWRIGYLGSGSANANYLVIQSAKAAGSSWNNVILLGNETLEATFGGPIYTIGSQYTDNFTSGGLFLNNSNILGVNAIYFADASESALEGINFYRSTTTVDTIWGASGVLYYSPNRTLGSNGTNYTILHTGNSSVSGGGSSVGSSITVNIGGTSKTLTIPSTSSYTNYLKIHDVRGTNHLPNSTTYPEKNIAAWFNNTGTPDSSWWSGITVKGWTSTYAVWQLCSYSSTGTANNYSLYLRNGINGDWGSWKTILDSSNYKSIIGSGAFWKVNGQTTVGTGDIYLEMWRGTNASWKMLNTSGILKFLCNYTSAAGSYYDALTVTYNTGNVWTKGSITSATGIHNSATTLYLDSASTTTSIIFRHGTTERMRIALPNGYVGIGTTAPIHKLQVTGAGVFSNTGSTTYASDGITIGAGDAVARYITCYGKTGLSYINIGYNAAANNSGELHFSYSSSGSTSNYVGLLLYGAANCVRIYPGYTQSIKYILAPNYVSSVATGTLPYACTSTTLNTNLNADMLDGYHASSFAIWRGAVQTDAEADDTTYTSTPSFLSMLHSRSSVFSTCFSAFRGSWYYVGNINCNTGVGTLEMAGTAVLNISGSTTNNEHSKTLLFIEGPTGNLYSYVKQSDGYNAIWSRYAKTTDIPNPANYYWANVKVSASSSTTTSPTFATATMTRGVVGGYNNTSYALSTASFICQSWVRTTGATGWYNETYAGGWYMTDTTYVRTYNSKAIYISNTGDYAIYTAGGFASSRTSGSVFATYYNGTWYCDTLYTHGNGNLSISPPGGSLYLAYNRGNTYFGGSTYYINRSGYFNGSCASANYTYRLAASSISDVNAPNWQEPGIRVDIYNASASNKPYSGNNANGVINFSFGKHGTSGHYGFLLAHGNGSNRLYFNQWTGGSRSGWKTIAWTSDIPSVGNGTVTIKQAGTTKGSFTMNQSGNTTIELTDNNTTYSFSNNNPTLAWGTKSTIGTVGGVALTVTMPANPNTNTHWTTRIYAGASGTAANAAATNPYLKVTDDNTYRNLVRFVGGGATTVSSDASGNITISSTNTTYSFAAKGSATQGIYLSGTNTFAAMTYSLKATVNAGTAGKLAYYSGANAISAYTSTVGDYSTPVYISGGVPISCYAKSVGSVTWGTSCSGYIYVYQFGPITILLGYISTINVSNTSSTNYVFKLPSSARTPSTSCGFALVQKDGYSNDRNTVIRLSGQYGYCDANYNDYNPAGSSYYFTAAYM